MDVWADGTRYEQYMGRWSRLAARAFVDWLNAASGLSWLDVGCGTGALSETILEHANPRQVRGIDGSEGFVRTANARLANEFLAQVADATALPFPDRSFDAVVSGFVLNFVPQPARAVAEMRRVSNGVVAFYVWDYAREMHFLRRFWDAAVRLDPSARERDEGVRFPMCTPDGLRALLDGDVTALVIPTRFRDFDDLWQPLVTGQGPAPGYVAQLDPTRVARLREELRASLPIAPDGSIELTARAWAIHNARR